ncbi:MAG: type IV pilus twitching motility protein PilT [Planctomycetota bacterium]
MPKIDELFKKMVEMKSSDLHFCVSQPPMVRKDGEVVPIPGYEANTTEFVKATLEEIMPERNKKEYDEGCDTDFAYALEGVGRFRANIFMDRKGWGGVFRLIPETILTADQLGLPEAVLKLCDMPKGLILVTGPTGSGKSTTLAAMIDYINKKKKDHILTIEDPIEFVHQNQGCLVNQREVHKHTKSFARALRAALRQDPDIVLVGEMRDLETTRIAIETAETGHLVFGTLHTSTAASTVDRLINQFPAEEQDQIRLMLAGSLKGVVAQTLLKKKGGGRCAALEILIMNTAVSSNVREGKTHQIESNMQINKKGGCVLLNDSLQKLVKEGKVEATDAYLKAVNKEDMLKKLGEIGVLFDATKVADHA